MGNYKLNPKSERIALSNQIQIQIFPPLDWHVQGISSNKCNLILIEWKTTSWIQKVRGPNKK